MSPTVFRESGYRFYFFSREESRMHIHVMCADGEAKYWLEPSIEVAVNIGLSSEQLKEIKNIIEVRYEEIKRAWRRYFCC